MAKTILLVDESPTIHKIVELTFADSEFRVDAFSDASAALEGIERIDPDLILADVALPGPSGYELCRAIKSSAHPVPVLLLAGTFEPLDRGLVADSGADGLIIKPFESQNLIDKVAELLSSAPAPDPPAVQEEEEAQATGALTDATTGAQSEGAGVPPLVDAPRATAEDLSPELVDAVTRAVVARLSESVIREIAWEVVPELARTMIRERIREIERED